MKITVWIRGVDGSHIAPLEFDSAIAADAAAASIILASNVKFTVIYDGNTKVAGYGKDEDGEPEHLIF